LVCGLFGTAFSYTKWLPLNLKVSIFYFPVNSADPERAPTRSYPAFPGFSCSHPRIALVALSRIDTTRVEADLLSVASLEEASSEETMTKRKLLFKLNRGLATKREDI
jgi:hypothetical protein